jgi:hypothetical protein
VGKPLGRPRHRWADIKLNLGIIGEVVWTGLIELRIGVLDNSRFLNWGRGGF